MSSNVVRFIHISDTHLGNSKETEILGVKSYPYSQKLVEILRKLPFTPDFIVNTGDVAAANGEEQGYIFAEELFSSLQLPTYYVTGNHDVSKTLLKNVSMGGREMLSQGDNQNAYRFDVAGIRFLTLDARGPDEIDPHGLLPDYQLDLVRSELEKGSMPRCIFIHFPALPTDSVWLDENMLLLNGDAFHRLLKAHAEKIRGVFFGHIHKGMTVFQDKVLYASVGSVFSQLLCYPHQKNAKHVAQPRGYFNIVTVTPEKTLIKEHSFGLDEDVSRLLL